MKASKQLLKSVKKLIETSFKDGKIIEIQVTKSIKILKSLPTALSILALSEYVKGLKRKEREHTMYVEAATPLSSTQLKKIKMLIEKKVKIAKVLVSINKELLGGFKVKVGDEIWDGSVMGKVQQVKETIRG